MLLGMCVCYKERYIVVQKNKKRKFQLHFFSTAAAVKVINMKIMHENKKESRGVRGMVCANRDDGMEWMIFFLLSFDGLDSTWVYVSYNIIIVEGINLFSGT